MARPLKQGVDYFPLDVHLDTKFKFVEIKFGLEGFGAVVRLMQMIYQQGYWAKWGDDEALLFSSENRIEFETLDGIVKECLKREVFNKELYEEHQILTSRGIQKRYKEIVRRRKDVNVITDYLLIDDIIQVNDYINPTRKDVIDDIKTSSSKHDDDKSTQRKGKEIEKEKEKDKENGEIDYISKIRDLSSLFSLISNFTSLSKKYWDVVRETRVSNNISESVIYRNMKSWSKYELPVVEYALKEHIKNHKGKREEYTIGIMRKTTVEEARMRLKGNWTVGAKDDKGDIFDKLRKEVGVNE